MRHLIAKLHLNEVPLLKGNFLLYRDTVHPRFLETDPYFTRFFLARTKLHNLSSSDTGLSPTLSFPFLSFQHKKKHEIRPHASVLQQLAHNPKWLFIIHDFFYLGKSIILPKIQSPCIFRKAT
jgi:hypothetical protein